MLHISTNPKPEDSHGYKEELNDKYSVITAISRKFPNGTEFLEYLLAKEVTPLNQNDYCGLPEADWVRLEGRADELLKAMLLRENSKNKAAKKDCCLAFAQGNHSAYPKICKQMV